MSVYSREWEFQFPVISAMRPWAGKFRPLILAADSLCEFVYWSNLFKECAMLGPLDMCFMSHMNVKQTSNFTKQLSPQQFAMSLSVSDSRSGRWAPVWESGKYGKSAATAILASLRLVYCVCLTKSWAEVCWSVWPVSFTEGLKTRRS